MSQDVFVGINNVVLDLQMAQQQTYEQLLKKLARLLRHPELEPFNAVLTEGLDLDSFIRNSGLTGGSMAGSAQLVWPDDPKEELGLKLLLIDKLGADPAWALNFSYKFFYSGKKFISSIHSLTRQLVVPFVRDYELYVQSKGNTQVMLKQHFSNRVFIVHGHDDGARETIARFLEGIGLEVVILHEQANQGRTIIEKVIAHSDVGFAVVLLTPDDEGCIKGGTPEPRARQNVVLELGYFIGRLGRERVCALKRGNLEIPSDFAGVLWTDMDGNGAWKQALARELKAADYQIDWNKVMC